MICLGDKAEKVISFEVGKSKTNKVTNYKVESKAKDSLISLTDDNKDLDNSQKPICLEDKDIGDNFTQTG